MSGDIGAGAQAAGASNGGAGEPEEAPPLTGVLFRDPVTGTPLDGRRINPVTRQYQYNDHGRIDGMRRTHQIILLACLTDEHSSAVRGMGNRLKQIQKLDETTNRRLQDVYQLALAKHGDILRLERIEAQRVGTNGAFVRIHFTDLTAGQPDFVDVPS